MAELLDEQALHKLSKDDLIKYAIKVSNIGTKVEELTDALAGFKSRLEISESQIEIVKVVNSKLQEQVEHLRGKQINNERYLTINTQYLRNRQVELKSFPTDISDDDLKPLVSKLLSLTGVEIKPVDIDKCHRLNNKNNVILEFNLREKRDEMLRLRKNLKGKATDLENMKMKRVMIVESLCPDYACLDFLCRKFAKNGQINQTWFFNGKLWIKENVDSEKVNITHITDLYSKFGCKAVDDLLGL